MSTLYIRLPSKAAADSATDRLALACQFALVSHGKTIEQQGAAPLAELSGTIARAQRVVLLLAASDVTLLRVKAPPLSHARLKAALPNLVEDQLIGDPSDCVVVAGSVADGLRTVAVAQRDWLDTLSRTLIACGARQIAALPAQLCLRDESMQSGSVLAAFSEQNNGIDLALRLSEHEGIGLAIDVGQNEVATHEAIRALCAVVPEAQVTLYVSQASVLSCQNEINNSGALNKRINVHADNWSRWIAGASNTTLDLMAGMGAGALPRVELRAWRWPLVLAAAVLAINIAALNFDWWRMRNEAKSLRAAMTEIYKSAFPKETVIIDPVAQMLQKIAAAKRAAGLPTADDFTAITAAFGEAWASAAAASGNAPAIAELEYRERSLFVRFKPGMEAPVQQMKTALAERNLTLEQESSGPAAVWKIRSEK